MARRPNLVTSGAGAAEPVTWRDGVHLTGTAIWCDARRARDVCFVSAADRPVRASHGQLIATRETLVMLASASGDHLAVPYRRPFTLGAVRLELVPTGHALGAAALWVEHGGRKLLYAGAIAGGRHLGLGEPGELRSADTLVIDAPYGAKEHKFPPAADASAAMVTWAQEAAARDQLAVAIVTSVGKGLDVAKQLADAGLDVVAHRAIHHAAQRLRTAGIQTVALRRPGATVRPGRALIWLARDRERLDAVAAPATRTVALVSGLATEPSAIAELGADVAFAWSNAADRDGLLALIRATGASTIFVTGRCAQAIVRAVGGTARVLGPPRQMGLFEEPAP